MRKKTRIAVLGLCLIALAVPACWLARLAPAPQPSGEKPMPPTASSSAAVRQKSEQPEATAIPAAPSAPIDPLMSNGPLAALARLADRMQRHDAPRTDVVESEASDDDPRDPIGTTIRALHRYLKARPDALADRPVVRRPGVDYWMDSNLVASNP